jgi:hypothetical protein
MNEIYVVALTKCVGGWQMTYHDVSTNETWTRIAKRKNALVVGAFLSGYHFSNVTGHESVFR